LAARKQGVSPSPFTLQVGEAKVFLIEVPAIF
jgi:hypothetical protein